jgi:hypothetical protein
MLDWKDNEAQLEQNAIMQANRRNEDAIQPITSVEDFDQRLSLADAFILHALGVTVTHYEQMLTP